MALYPPAEKRLLAPGLNHSTGGMGAVRGVILHVIVGSLMAADAVFHDPTHKASAHLGVDFDGRVVQWVDTHDKAWAEGAGNPYWISVETAGRPEQPLTPAQVSSVAAIVRWAHDLYHFPLQVTDSPNTSGLGTHQMGGIAWGGHACPGAVRAVQRTEIIRIAAGVPAPGPVPGPAPTGVQDMKYIFQLEGHPHTFVCDGIYSRHHLDPDDHNNTVWHIAANHGDTHVYTEKVDEAKRKPLVGPFDPGLLALGFVAA